MENFNQADVASLRESVEYLRELKLKIEANGTFIVDATDMVKIDSAAQYINIFRMILESGAQIDPFSVHQS
jgi:predicted membrane-bound spermidine synthase